MTGDSKSDFQRLWELVAGLHSTVRSVGEHVDIAERLEREGRSPALTAADRARLAAALSGVLGRLSAAVHDVVFVISPGREFRPEELAGAGAQSPDAP
jgi:hypothetical protein